MLCLPAPYGWPSGTAISLRTKGGAKIDGSIVAGLVLGFGCPPFILSRVASAMSASGRYDCRVTLSQEALNNLKCCAEQIGVEVVLHDPENSRFRAFSHLDYR